MQSDANLHGKKAVQIFLLKRKLFSARMMKKCRKVLKMKKLKREIEPQRVSVCVSDELLEYIDKFCNEFGCSRSSFITVVLGQYVRQQRMQSDAIQSMCKGFTDAATNVLQQQQDSAPRLCSDKAEDR